MTRDKQSFQTYRENKAINWSTLQYMKKSPLDYKMARDYPSLPSESQKLGTLVHCGLLEPSEVWNRYTVSSPIKWKSRSEKNATINSYFELFGYADKMPEEVEDERKELLTMRKEEFLAWVDTKSESLGKTLLPNAGGNSEPFNWKKANKIIETNKNKPAFCVMWDSMEAVEQELYATCEETGLPLKGLVDIITTQSLVDLKTVGTVGKMHYNIKAFNYLGQLAFYDYLARLNNIHKRKFFIMFIETVSPYKMKVLEVDPRIIAEQHEANIELLKQLKQCIERDSFPDGSDQVEYYEYRGEDQDSAMSEDEWLRQTEEAGQDSL